MKQILYLVEFIIILILFIIFRLMPINFVSVIGGKLFQIIGPFSKSHNTAIKNFKKVFYKLNIEEVKTNISKSWNNLGRTFIEIIILNKLLKKENKRIKVIGIENLNQIKKKNEQVIFFGIHQANWELLVPTLDKLGIHVIAIYRHINNPYINRFILNLRTQSLHSEETFYTPKGKESAKEILNAINKGKSIILLIDQKDNAGSEINLFNYNVKTQTGFLKIAKKNKLKLIPVQTIRKNINHFNIIFHSHIDPFINNQNEIEAMKKIHGIIEKWIKENPDQWLWQHKRFD